MQPDFWHARWSRNEIGFHQDTVNRYLLEHWSILGLNGDEPILVPLCGKSLDMLWINRLGHPVIGVELSPVACQQFFAEAGVTPEISHSGAYEIYRSDGITLLCGDFFQLAPNNLDAATAVALAKVGAVFDRAALIALPEAMRAQYAQYLTNLLPPAAQVLLVTMQYPQQDMQGPPFSVEPAEVRKLYEPQWTVQLIHEHELGRDDPFAKRRGLSDMTEAVYKLQRKTGI